jgi:argininosuccinate lyase
MRAVDPRIGPAVYQVLSVERALESRSSQGGTAPAAVRRAIAAARARYL